MSKQIRFSILSIYLGVLRRNKCAVFLVVATLAFFAYASLILPGQVTRNRETQPTVTEIGQVVSVTRNFRKYGGQSQSISVQVTHGYVGGLSTLPVKVGDSVEIQYTEFEGKPERMASVHAVPQATK
ncbi:hypothetical protein [Burkholderia sp. PAMC 26561]|uniref:hypothetical protein n=1 Tax=Burkholderia sp. PAMC 26561 TaxID=1795043 RepID=UPI00076B722E|nr:hypothetical protein [Burkholderia sp. PAMC 26561]AME28266.1 hypothetical protein AXG89_31040 [Burkholderia sp. PAMC 26561]